MARWLGWCVVLAACSSSSTERPVPAPAPEPVAALPDALPVEPPATRSPRGPVTAGASLRVEIAMADDDPHQDDRSIARRFIARESGKLSMCYEARAQGDASFNAGIGLSVELAPGGGAPTAVTATKGDAQIAACTRAVIAAILFPAPDAGAVTLPVQLLFRQRQL